MQNLGNNLQNIFSSLKSKTQINKENIKTATNAVKVSLLEADVNLAVVNKINDGIVTKMLGHEVIKGVSASEQFIKAVYDEILNVLSQNQKSFNTEYPFHKMMFVGLQGSGKTTSIAKVTKFLQEKKDKKVLVVAADIYRPAAIEQLQKLAQNNSFEVFEKGTQNPSKTVKEAMKYAQDNKFDTVIVDTAGRLQIDQKLMNELIQINEILNPQDCFIAIDALSGQEILSVTQGFNEAVQLTGVVLTKADGNSKGGAALSIKHALGVSIMFVGTGEKISKLEEFFPERFAKKILGMQDTVSLVEKAKEIIDEKTATRVGLKIMSGKFNFKDMLFQMKSVQKLGVGKLAGLIPGIPKITEEQRIKLNEQIKITEALINSMTEIERKNPKLFSKEKTRKTRIIKGSGRNAQEYNKLMTNYDQMIKVAKMMKNNKMGLKGFPKF